jgi:hypothetical protein
MGTMSDLALKTSGEYQRPLNLVWRRASLDRVLEGYFIKEVLLGGVRRPVRQVLLEDNGGGTLEHDSLFVVLRGDLSDVVRAARENGLQNIGVLQLGDEGGVNDRSFYKHADYVLRHYWFEEIIRLDAKQKVVWVPNGYRTGVGPIDPARTLSMHSRRLMGFFAGSFHQQSLNHERMEMMRVIQEAKLPFLLCGSEGFGIGLSPSAYAGLMGDSRFALAPGGMSPETIRLYDALEHGAIPILLETSYIESADALGALGRPPLVTLDHWSSLPVVFRDLNRLPMAQLEDRRLEILDWWTRFKQHLKNRVRDLIEASFAQSRTTHKS